MKEIYLLLGGWSRAHDSYTQLVHAKPKGVEVYILPHAYLDLHHKQDGVNADILRFLDKHRLENITLVGQSLGGALAIKFASAYPHRVKRLVLIDSAGVYDEETMLSMTFTLLHTHFFMHGRRKMRYNIRSFLRSLHHPKLYTRAGKFAFMVDVQEEAKRVTVPTTIIWGEKDTMIPPRLGKQLHQLINHSSYIELPNMDHDWLLHRPDLFWENVL